MANRHYPTLQPFPTGANETTDRIVSHAAEQLHGLKRTALIQLRVIEAGAAGTLTTLSIELTPTGVLTNPETVAEPALAIVTTADTLRRMADGSYSPIAAYLEGKVAVRGDVGLAGQIIQNLGAGAPSAGSYVCPYLTNPQWQDQPGNPYGSFTISGIWFSSEGLVDLQFSYQISSGVPFTLIATIMADSEGQFTFTLPEVKCGDLPGENYGIGVVAIDLTTGKSTSSNYAFTGGVNNEAVITASEYSTPCFGPPPTSNSYVAHVVYVDGDGHLQEVAFGVISGSGAPGPWLYVTDITAQSGGPPAQSSSGLTSWFDGTYQHVVYLSDGHLLDAFCPITVSSGPPLSGGWQVNDITAQISAIVAPSGSPLTSWVDANYQHVICIDFNGNVWQVACPIGQVGQWQQPTNVTSQTSGQFLGYALISWQDDVYQRVGYIGTDNFDISQVNLAVAYCPLGQSGKWNSFDLLDLVDGSDPFVNAGSPLTSWVSTSASGGSPGSLTGGASYQHVAYVSATGHLVDAYSLIDQNASWQTTDITQQTGAPDPSGGPVWAGGSALTSWADTNNWNQYIAYIDGNGHLQVVASVSEGSGEQWQPFDVTNQTGAPLAASGAGQTSWATGALTSWLDRALYEHVVYIDGSGHLREVFRPVGGGEWQTNDITGQTGAPVAASHSPLSRWTTPEIFVG